MISTTTTSPAQDFEYKRPWMYDKQEEAIFNDSRMAVVEASTKSGKTVGCIVWLFEQALKGNEGHNYWWIAPVSDQTDIAFRRMKAAVPKFVVDRKNENYKFIELVNGTRITFKSGDAPDSLYGEDVYAAVIDEASRVKEESWHAVRSTLTATKGPVRIIGNVKGKKNWAYRLARAVEDGQLEDAEFHKITWKDAVESGVLDEDEIEAARATLPEAVFKELYGAEAADDTGNPFGIDYIHQCIQRDEDGKWSEKPIGGKPICWGWDVAKSRNYTVGIALDRDGNVTKFIRFQKPWELTINEIITSTKGLPALVDSTGTGDQLLERLQKDGGYNFHGFKFTTTSKQNLMVGLAVAIQNNEITFPEGRIVRELEMFEYEQKRDKVLYSAPEGYHDDCVDALAMAVKRWKSGAYNLGDIEMPRMEVGSYWKSL